MKPALPAAQARVLRRLFLTLMLRGRRSAQGRPRRLAPLVGFGLLLGFFALFGAVAFGMPRRDLFIFAGCLHALAFLMVGMNLAISTGQLLFNPEEADVLLHRPIAPRALLSAKVQTIAFFSLALGVAMSFCGLIAGVAGTEAGWLFLPVHLFTLSLEILFGSSFIVLAYNLSLHWFGRERLENLMTSVQVVVAVTLMLGGQLVPRLLIHTDFAEGHLPWWINFFPPVWFAALDVLLTGAHSARPLVAPTLCGMVATTGTVWLGVVRLASTYELGLEALNEAGAAAVRPGGHGRLIDRWRRWPLLRWWLRDPVEAAGFHLTLAQLSRARGVKLRIYPMLAQLLVYPIILLFGGARQANGFSMEPYVVAYAGYFMAMLPTLVLDRLRPSEDYEAAAIFRQAPLRAPAALFHGTRKGVIFALCLPCLVLVTALGGLFLDDRWQLLLLLPGLVALPLFSLLGSPAGLFVPFAEPVEGGARGLRVTVLVIAFQLGSFLLAAVAGWCWSIGWFPWLLLVEAPVALGGAFLLRVLLRGQRFPDED